MADPLADIIIDRDPLTIARWEDELAAGWWPMRGAYVSTFWLPVIGPTPYALARVMLRETLAGPATFDLAELGRSVGVGGGANRNAKVVGSLARMAHYGVCRLTPTRLEVRPALCTLSPRLVDRLSPRLQAAHARHLARASVTAPDTCDFASRQEER